MCEFKIVRKNDGSQLGEEVVVAGYGENYELLFSDILGVSLSSESALITEVNTLNQTLSVVEHPILKEFVGLAKSLASKTATSDQIDRIQQQLESLKSEL